MKFLFFIAFITSLKSEEINSFEQKGCNATHEGGLKNHQTTLSRKCFISSLPGNCLGYYRSYHYDPEISGCVLSSFGGCNDGCMAFKSRAECEKACIKGKAVKLNKTEPFAQKGCELSITAKYISVFDDLPAKCFIASKKGDCIITKPSYHFDYIKSKCVSSIFGGCDDGCLAFKTKLECEKSCIKSDTE
ncbi:hypothetical protein K502DRAFT_366749 [Neoconidiobolus thromboides FSU 785]|nr:hypothetical protein K502DRAFT_366749 [Neoconidiobolus thromboides FSU 785]